MHFLIKLWRNRLEADVIYNFLYQPENLDLLPQVRVVSSENFTTQLRHFFSYFCLCNDYQNHSDIFVTVHFTALWHPVRRYYHHAIFAAD